MRKLIIFIGFLAMILLISGCEIPSLSLGGGKTQAISGKGVVVNFLPDMPPLGSIGEGEGFWIGLNLKNYLTEPIDVNIKISDTPPMDYGGIESFEEIDVSVEGAWFDGSKYVPGEEEIILPDYDYGYVYSGVYKGMTTNIIVELVADYNAHLNPQFCVKKKLSSLTINCADKEIWRGEKLFGIKKGETSAGYSAMYSPVGITSIKKEVRHIGKEGDRAILDLELNFENLDKGDIVFDENIKKRLIKNLNIESLSYGDFNCYIVGRTGSAENFELRNGKAIVKCKQTFDLSDEEFIQDSLDISYDYSYEIKDVTDAIDVIPRYEEDSGFA